MKKYFFSLLTVLIALTATAQTNVELRINHNLASQPFQMNTTAQNNNGQDFQVTRLQYYVTRISVIHDGNQVLPIVDDTLALVNTENGPFTSIPLGNLNVTSIEGVKFHIGVWSPMNTADPSLWPMGHPLAPQSPSMHWGWASGYRFLVYEGKGGANFSQVFQLHALGDQNYFEATVMAPGQAHNGGELINVNADYTRGVENIQVGNGTISHGDNGAALVALNNFQNYVFSAAPGSVGVEEMTISDWMVYPNPAGNAVAFNVQLPANHQLTKVVVSNVLGQTVLELPIVGSNAISFELADAGLYTISLHDASGTISTKRIVKQ